MSASGRGRAQRSRIKPSITASRAVSTKIIRMPPDATHAPRKGVTEEEWEKTHGPSCQQAAEEEISICMPRRTAVRNTDATLARGAGAGGVLAASPECSRRIASTLCIVPAVAFTALHSN
jgi:hypothetical protein